MIKPHATLVGLPKEPALRAPTRAVPGICDRARQEAERRVVGRRDRPAETQRAAPGVLPGRR
jgi:hypothetical protein